MRKQLLLLGHRGARAERQIPENSMASFELCMAHGCDGFEFDVRQSSEGRAVICHDPVWRATGKGRPGVEVAGASLAELDGIAQLDGVLAKFAGSAYLDIELKVSGVEEAVADAVRKFRPQKYVVSSFLPEVLKAVHGMAEEIPLGLICETHEQMAEWKRLPVAAVIPQWKLARQELVEELHGAKKEILVWTVNEETKMRELADWGVDGVISDETDRLVKTLRG